MINKEFRRKYSLQQCKKQGQGGQGKILTAVNLESGNTVIVKKIVNDASGIAACAWRERQALSSLSHQNVIKLLDSYCEGNSTLLILEKCEVDLSVLLQAVRISGQFSVGNRHFLLQSLFQALSYIHGQGFVHRDVKLSNVLLMRDSTVKLSDFGLSVKNPLGLPLSDAGSKFYKAPELLLNSKIKGREGDLFAAGMLALHLLLNCDDEEVTVYDLIAQEQTDHSAGQIINILSQLLGTPKREELAHINDMYFQTYFSEHVEGKLAEILLQFEASEEEVKIITGLIRWDPAQRIGADECCKLLQGAQTEQIDVAKILNIKKAHEEEKEQIAPPMQVQELNMNDLDAPLAGLDQSTDFCTSLFKSGLL
ncbi:Kinase [Hexamita inflata]|uniref:CMGC CDK n=1 Tax=Hexamita inflata TaxID=28002 RepID=A0AA86PUX4_9EUKA|nr:CMGC CDK [Hexamita inflata]